MKLLKLLTFLILIVLSYDLNAQSFNIPNLSPSSSTALFSDKTIVFKIKSAFRTSCFDNKIELAGFKQFFSSITAKNARKAFPGHTAPTAQKNRKGEKLTDLSLIYILTYDSDMPLNKAISRLISTGLVEYAEPHYIPQLTYVPNDTLVTKQYCLTNINAFAGWDISKGDSNVVIGITDTGTDLTHPDLGNLKYNYADPVNGTDDDGDGYVDNFQGWDLGMNDNDPTWEVNPHGMHVSGLAAAKADNVTGIAGVSFNCRYLPVKISDSTGSLTKAYEGIVYAADHNCSVINCSWGSPGGGQFGQDIINYAVFNKNALVVAAAGNNGMLMDFYPASYDNVLSVAATDSFDVKWSGSNYGYNIDVCTPGKEVLSTWLAGYVNGTGTSMASPVAAGAAALVRSVFPSYTALQAGEQLKATCDDIYSLNPSYQDLLGNGRVNIFRALTDSTNKAVVMTRRTITDNNDKAFNSNDTLRISATMTNYLAPLSNLTVTLSSASSDVMILDGLSTFGAMSTLDTSNNNSDPFLVKILPSATMNESILFKLTYNDGAYSSVKYFTITVNVDYINIVINDVTTTITSRGRIGYNKENQSEGLGFTYNGSATLLYEASFMTGVPGKVSDMSRGDSFTADNDFESVTSVKNVVPPVYSEFDVKGQFDDDLSPAPLKALVSHSAYAWSSPGNTKFVIVSYNIKNNGIGFLDSVYAGIFADWDIMDYSKNKADYDSSLKMGYAWSTEAGGLFTGIKLLSHTPAVHYAIDNGTGGGGGIDISDGYSTSEKYTTLSTNRPSAGGSGSGNDISDVMGSGPFTLAPGQTKTVSFALIGGDNLSDLQLSATNAQQRFDSLVPEINDTVIIPPGLSLDVYYYALSGPPYPKVHFTVDKTAPVTLTLIDMMGRKIAILINTTLNSGEYSLNLDLTPFASGVYILQLRSEDKFVVKKVRLLK